MIHQPSGGIRPTSDIDITAKHIIKTENDSTKCSPKLLGQKVEQDVDRDLFMDADEAKAYGIVDAIYK